ncbi:MAG TPA: cytochrome c3 family protein [Gemmatimonadales bacterium]|jgi:hypothetical protein|nr:cytochrome c3 family protein [Gemmatimonadales bacterium]
MRKRFLIGLGAVLLAGTAIAVGSRVTSAQQPAPPAGTAVTLTRADSVRLEGPRQPIFFRHDVHAGQLKMQCQYCHYSVSYSSEPGIPSMQTCMGCHMYVSGSTPTNKAEIRKLTTAWGKKQPVQWIRIHELARHVHFPHSRHIFALGPDACATCHGNIARMPQVYKVNNVNNMGFCITCHIERKVTRDCSTCHY